LRMLTNVCVFFSNHPTTTEIYTLSLHDALPILRRRWQIWGPRQRTETKKQMGPAREQRQLLRQKRFRRRRSRRFDRKRRRKPKRSEEHTSELQSRSDLVCRLLLEKKKKITKN